MPWHPWEDLLALVELAAPSACAGCGRAALRWCPACDRELTRTPPHPWSPTPCPPGLPPTWSGPAYEGAVRAAVVAWKDGGRADLTAVLAPVLRGVLATALAASEPHRSTLAARGTVVVVPAPSSRAATRRRGEHRVRALTLAALGGRGGDGRGRGGTRLPVVDGLELARAVDDQAGLGAQERARNLTGALRARGRDLAPVRGLPCVVVDDVITTGATLRECARALRAAGSGPVAAVTLAATRRRGTSAAAAREGPSEGVSGHPRSTSRDSRSLPLSKSRDAD